MVTRKHLFGCRGGQKVLFSRNVKPGVFGLGIAPKKIFIAYPTQFVFLTTILDLELWSRSWLICAEKPHNGGVDIRNYMKIYFNIFVFFIVGTTSIFVSYCLLVLPWWYLGWLCCCHYYCCFIYLLTYLFIYLFILFVCVFYLFIHLLVYFFDYSYLCCCCCCCCHRCHCFCCWCHCCFFVCLVIGDANIMLTFPILV